MEDKTERKVTVQKGKKKCSQKKKTIFNLTVHLDLQKIMLKKKKSDGKYNFSTEETSILSSLKCSTKCLLCEKLIFVLIQHSEGPLKILPSFWY